jgi:hypothetical protein
VDLIEIERAFLKQLSPEKWISTPITAESSIVQFMALLPPPQDRHRLHLDLLRRGKSRRAQAQRTLSIRGGSSYRNCEPLDRRKCFGFDR